MKFFSFALLVGCTSAFAVNSIRSQSTMVSKHNAKSNDNLNAFHGATAYKRYARTKQALSMQDGDSSGAAPAVIAKGGDATIAASTFNLAKCKFIDQSCYVFTCTYTL